MWPQKKKKNVLFYMCDQNVNVGNENTKNKNKLTLNVWK
jgi:hypothetical protein